MRIEKLSPTVFTPLEDGTGVLLNLDTLFYYSLNRTGVVLWKEIESSQSFTLEDLISVTRGRFEVEEPAARREIEAFVERLAQFKMVRIG